MRNLCALLVIFVLTPLTAAPSPQPSLEIEINGQPARLPPEEELISLTYNLPTTSGLRRGVSLDELIPVMTEVHRLVVRTSTDRRVWEEDDLAERLSGFYVLLSATDSAKTGASGADSSRASPSNEGSAIAVWDLLVGDELFPAVRRIEVGGEPLQDREIEVWISWEGAKQLRGEIERFGRLHGIDTKVVEVPKTKSKLISVLRGGGTVPDVVMIQSDYLPTLIQARALQSLNYLSHRTLSEKGLEAFRVEGKRWAVPLYFDTQLVFYNRRILSGSIPEDWTLEDLERLAESLKSQKRIPLAWNAYSAYWLIPFQMGFGKESLIERDGSVIINDAPTERALNYLIRLRDRGLLHVMERDAMISLFASDRVALILSGSYSIPQFSEIGLDFGVVPFPFNAASGRFVSPLLDFKGLAIPRKSRRPILARRLIQYLTNIGVQQRFPPALSKLPAAEAAWNLMTAGQPHSWALRRSFEIGTPILPQRSYALFKNTMWKLLRFALSGQMSVERVLEEGQRILDAQIHR